MTGLAAVAGAFAFLGGLAVLLQAFAISEDSPERKLFQINAVVGTGVLYLALGGFLVVQAASALGDTSSSPIRFRKPWVLVLLFPALVAIGQLMAANPGRLPWLFPFLNIAMISVPSLSIAAIVTARYTAAHPFAWPISWREWTSALIYGAVGATSLAVVINTAWLFGGGYLLIQTVGGGPTFEDFALDLQQLPRAWGIFFDLSVLSICAPLNEEFFKGLIVALFFFRRGGVARCFTWGVLAGAGFNLLETFQNSLGAVSPDALADQTIGSEWWFFALARAGTAAMHALATGLAALGFYGLFRRRWTLTPAYFAGVLLHATWNFLVYAIWGDALFSGSGPDSRALDILGGVGLIVVFAASVVMLWLLSGRLRDDAPAPIYALLGMLPARTSGSDPPGTLTASAPGETENATGVSPA